MRLSPNAFLMPIVVAGAWRGSELEIDPLAGTWRLGLFDLLHLLDARLDLRGVTGPRLEPIDEGLLFGQHRLLASELRRLLLLAQLVLLPVEVVVARVAGHLAAVDVDDAVEERAIVSRDDETAFEGFEESFQPNDRLQVEVVGWLVEQQYVGARKQDARQGNTESQARPWQTSPAFATRSGSPRLAKRSGDGVQARRALPPAALGARLPQ